jgi:aspartate aminotransferase
MNPRIKELAGSTIRALHARRGPTSIDLGLGEPTLKPDVSYFERATHWVAKHGCPYSPNAGDTELRHAIAEYYAYPSLERANNVCITTGSQEAVYATLKTLIDPARDEILLVEPAFPIYVKIAQIEGIAVRRVTLSAEDGFAFDAERILEGLSDRTRAIVLCSPCNPTGRVISTAAVQRIASVLGSRPGPPVYLIHDEIYREQCYVPDPGEFGRHYPHTVAINSLSKSNALTGLRLGWLIGPSEVVPEIVKMHGWLTSCASTFAQRIALEIFHAKALEAQRPWYAAQRDGAVARARECGFELVEPEGTFYLCLKVGARNSLAFCEALLDEHDVVTVPGNIFGSTMEGWIRTSFVQPLDAIAEGYRRIAAFATVSS